MGRERENEQNQSCFGQQDDQFRRAHARHEAPTILRAVGVACSCTRLHASACGLTVVSGAASCWAGRPILKILFNLHVAKAELKYHVCHVPSSPSVMGR